MPTRSRRLFWRATQSPSSSRPDAVDKFLDDQRHLVNQLAAVVGAGARATVDTSLVLLDALAARSHALRAALACGVGSIQKSDSLGPLAQACPPPAGAQPQTAPQ